jgi:hypothetical protein
MFQFEQILQVNWYHMETKSFHIPGKDSYVQELCCSL